jgi:hypothetical protein
MYSLFGRAIVERRTSVYCSSLGFSLFLGVYPAVAFASLPIEPALGQQLQVAQRSLGGLGEEAPSKELEGGLALPLVEQEAVHPGLREQQLVQKLVGQEAVHQGVPRP